MVTLGPSGEILVDNREVGELVYDENHIKKVEIDTKEQNQGYGTEAVRQYLDRMVSNDYNRVTTTPATTPAMRHIFRKLGFQRVEDPAEHEFLEQGPSERYKTCFVKEFHSD